jgi:hypothetical protein
MVAVHDQNGEVGRRPSMVVGAAGVTDPRPKLGGHRVFAFVLPGCAPVEPLAVPFFFGIGINAGFSEPEAGCDRRRVGEAMMRVDTQSIGQIYGQGKALGQRYRCEIFTRTQSNPTNVDRRPATVIIRRQYFPKFSVPNTVRRPHALNRAEQRAFLQELVIGRDHVFRHVPDRPPRL